MTFRIILNFSSYKENGNEKVASTWTQKETVDISGTQNEQRGLGELDTHKAYWKKKDRGKHLVNYLTSLDKWIAKQKVGAIAKRKHCSENKG